MWLDLEVLLVFFFFKQKTAYERRIRDWISDVCSSDLVRYITLAHSAANAIADSSYAIERKWHGLSPFGKQVVAEMNRLGIMVDVSHLSDESAAAAIELSTVPVIASHSAFRHFTPDFERNISDGLAKRSEEQQSELQP